MPKTKSGLLSKLLKHFSTSFIIISPGLMTPWHFLCPLGSGSPGSEMLSNLLKERKFLN